jgi:hypothetical protein
MTEALKFLVSHVISLKANNLDQTKKLENNGETHSKFDSHYFQK